MNLYFEMGVLKDEAVFPEALPVWQAAFALEGLLKQLIEKMRNVTPSTLRPSLAAWICWKTCACRDCNRIS